MIPPAAPRFRRLTPLALVGLLLLAAAFYQASTLPGQLGLLRDDGMYALFARALASGQGYVDLSIAGHPPAIRYPIGFPALLSLSLLGSHGLADQVVRLQLVPPVLGAAFVAMSFAYYRSQLQWAAGAALATATVVAFHPAIVSQATLLMSDLAFGILALAALFATERALEKPGVARGLGAGALVGLACLTRYFGVVLVVAAIAVMAQRRDGRTLVTFVAGLGPVVGAWAAFRWSIGGETYLQEVSSQFSRDGAAVMTASQSILTIGLPQIGLPGLVEMPAPVAAVASLLLALALLGGLWAWGRSPLGRTSPVAPMYVALTLAVAAAMEVGYPSYGGHLFIRYTLPVLPLLPVALVALGARALSQRPQLRRSLAIGMLAAFGLACAVVDGGQLRRHQAFVMATHGLADHARLQAFIRKETRADARLIDPYGHALAFYTGRVSYTFPYAPTLRAHEVSVGQLHQEIVARGVTHVVGLPQVVEGEDMTVGTLNAFNRTYPGLLTPIHVSPTGRHVVFAVTR